jgi:hypothetical protein
MQRFVRVLLLGAVTIGIVLALTSATSSSGPLGQATGYGDSVLQPCPPGSDTAPGGGPCLQDLEVASGETASEQSGDDDGVTTTQWLLAGLGLATLAGGGAFAYARLRH